MRAGKHVLIEIPLADSLADVEDLVRIAQETGVVAMAGHVRRFNPSHQYIHNRIAASELAIQQMNVQTYFFRRSNTNALGQARSWTDHLLWHHACHTVDLFQWQTGEVAEIANAIQGPIHAQLGIAMDMSIQLKVASGALLSLSLSFNNDGPLGSFFRYIGDTGTYLAYYDDLSDGKNNTIDLSNVAVSMNGIELEDREFFAAIRRLANRNQAYWTPCPRTLRSNASNNSSAASSPPNTRLRNASNHRGLRQRRGCACLLSTSRRIVAPTVKAVHALICSCRILHWTATLSLRQKGRRPYNRIDRSNVAPQSTPAILNSGRFCRSTSAAARTYRIGR